MNTLPKSPKIVGNFHKFPSQMNASGVTFRKDFVDAMMSDRTLNLQNRGRRNISISYAASVRKSYEVYNMHIKLRNKDIHYS